MNRFRRRPIQPLTEAQLARVKTDDFARTVIFLLSQTSSGFEGDGMSLVLVYTAAVLAGDGTGFIRGACIWPFIKKYRQQVEGTAMAAVVRGIELSLQEGSLTAEEIGLARKAVDLIVARHPECRESGGRVLALLEPVHNSDIQGSPDVPSLYEA